MMKILIIINILQLMAYASLYLDYHLMCKEHDVLKQHLQNMGEVFRKLLGDNDEA